MVIATPLHLGKLGGRCVSIEILKMDSWRVKNVFKSNNGVSSEAISSYMYKLSNHPKITESISFERYPYTKKFLLCNKDPKGEVEVKVPIDRVNGGVAMCKVDIFRISKFIVGDPGEPYCTIPIKCLKLLNKFLGMTINASKTEFCKSEDDYLFSIGNQYYHTDIRLT